MLVKLQRHSISYRSMEAKAEAKAEAKVGAEAGIGLRDCRKL